jgi:sirohydrochlorin cobaltochelatase
LQTHPLLLDAFAERVEEALHGSGHMNCSLCQYRVPIIGHETAVGQPQAPHHHHVQGLHKHEHHLEEHEETGSHLWTGELLEQLRF